MVAHHYFFDGDINVLFGANTWYWSAKFAIKFWNIEFNLIEELEAMIAKIKI
jgi:hypothetical protein